MTIHHQGVKVTLASYLVVTGTMALIAIVVPGLVIAGLFLLVLPGLLLSLAPAAFLYGVAFAAIRVVLGTILSGAVLNLASAALTVALFWALPQAGQARARALLADAMLPVITPSGRIMFTGDVRIEHRSETSCDSLCAALLTTPSVTSVTITPMSKPSSRRRRTWRLVPFDAPGKPEKAVGFGFDDPAIPQSADGNQALEAAWNLRLARGLKLVGSDDAPAADMTITHDERPIHDVKADVWSLQPQPGRIATAELRDAGGRVLLRRQVASIAAPIAPLFSTLSGSVERGEVGWATSTFSRPARYSQIDFDAQLLAHTNLARGVDRAEMMKQARTELVRALDDPSRDTGDAGLNLAYQWLGTFRVVQTLAPADISMKAQDIALFERIVADPRITKADGVAYALRMMGAESVRFRRLIEARLLDPAVVRQKQGWQGALSELPVGAFAEQTPEERIILADPELSRFAPTIIARQADRGPAALPDLVRLLEEHATVDPGRYGNGDADTAINGIRRALHALGPVAAPALPQVEALFGQHKRLQQSRGQEWDTALVTMGMPLARAIKPDNVSGTEQAYRDRVATSASRPYDPDRR